MSLGIPGKDPEESASGPGNEPEKPYRGLKWVFIGAQGLRAGWSILIFVVLMILFANGLGFVFSRLHLISKGSAFAPRQQFFIELLEVVSLVAAAAVVALIERRQHPRLQPARTPSRDALLQRVRRWIRRTLCARRITGLGQLASLRPRRAPRSTNRQVRRRLGRRLPARWLF